MDYKIFKSSDEQQLVFGWASVSVTNAGETVIDYDEDIIRPEVLEKAAYEYVLDFRDGGERHDPGRRKTARLIESVVFTKTKMEAMGLPEGLLPEGWWVGFKVDDPHTWKQIKNGNFKMFSIEGRARRIDGTEISD